MNAQDYLIRYYSQYDEQGRLETRCGHVEYVTTMEYIGRYLEPGMRVLEIGAGTGRYSHALARMGYEVDAVELVEHNIEVFKAHTQQDERVEIFQGNALDLSCFEDNTYDVVLLLGPMYHLFSKSEQRQALCEAVRVAKPGGVIFAAYCMSDASIVQYGFRKGNIGILMENGLIDPQSFETFSNPCDLFALHRSEDVAALSEGLPVTRLHLLAADGYAHHMRDVIGQMDEDTYMLFIRYHLATCERQDMIGYSNHTLDVLRKDGGESA